MKRTPPDRNFLHAATAFMIFYIIMLAIFVIAVILVLKEAS